MLAASGAALAAEAPAADPRAAAKAHWQGLARNDLDFAYVLLRDNHPAMAPELGEAAFSARVEAAYTAARARLEKVESHGGLRHTLEAFAAAAEDAHVFADFALQRKYFVWPRFLTRTDGERYFTVGAGDNLPAEGSELIACDGIAAADLAKQRIAPTVADWSIEAQRAANAWRLLVDERNGFVAAPKTCVFEKDGARTEMALGWTGSTYDTIAPVIAATSQRADAGYGVERLDDGGFWIAMEGMHAEAEAVVKAAEARKAELRAAPYVVVDVRGNGGGSSSYGDRLAKILFGRAPAYDGPPMRDAWRVSKGNAAAMEDDAKNAARERPGDKDYAQWTRSTADTLKKALDAGRPFAPASPKKGETAPDFVDPAGGRPGEARIYLLTDNACFSSCLLMADSFKRLGAAHVGRATNAATRYMESRGEFLPSRLGYFYILQKVSLGSPARIGPYVPAARFDGDMRDKEALKAWIAGLAAKKSGA
jgi:hypothetical protein